jgi:hypothetical protein
MAFNATNSQVHRRTLTACFIYFCPMKKMLYAVLSLPLFFSCTPSNENLMSKDQLGSLQSTDSIGLVSSLFPGDSIDFERLNTGQIVGLSVLNANQKKRFQLRANLEGAIEVVQVYDGLYKTKKGIGVGNTLGELEKVYTIERAVLFLFDRSELPESIKYSFDPIDPVQLPSEAVINQVIISW